MSERPSDVALRPPCGGNDAPLVSVAMTAFNHEAFIAQAIESALSQQASFGVEIVISDDASTDQTAAIIEECRRRFPERIRVLPSGPRLGVALNTARVFAACRGRYVALLEGDDYWTAPHKLARQAAFLESHPQCAFCCHAVRVIGPALPAEGKLHPRRRLPEIATLDHLLRGNFVAGSSVLLRRENLAPAPPWLRALPIRDWPYWALQAQRGDIGYLAEPMGVYRRHAGGTWSSQSEQSATAQAVWTLRVLRRQLPVAHRAIIDRRLVKLSRKLALLTLGHAPGPSRMQARRCLVHGGRRWRARIGLWPWRLGQMSPALARRLVVRRWPSAGRDRQEKQDRPTATRT